MTLVELNRPPLEGELNISCFVVNPQGQVLLGRRPKDNPRIMRSIENEYHFIGFTDKGGMFRRRAPQEQVDFVEHAASHGLRVLTPALVDTLDIVYYPFLNQTNTLDDYLPFCSDQDLSLTVFELFNDLRKAHRAGIVYGDRWSRNILVSPRFGIVHIDFDIEISGRPAKEFEVAQAAYYTLCAGKSRAIPLLSGILSGGKEWFDFNLVAQFLQKHAVHFLHSQRYGNVEDETNILIELVRKKMLDGSY